jgi:hypothetical protein
MDTLPQRDDLIYKEIEEFQDYELTNCVAYEMAIRNNKNFEKIDNVIRFYEENKDFISYWISEKKEYDEKLFLTGSEKHHIIIEMLLNIEILPFFEYGDIISFIDNRIKNRIYEIIKILNNQYKSDEIIIKFDNANIIYNDLLSSIILSRIIEKEGYKIITELYVEDEHGFIPIDKNDENSDYKQIETIEDFNDFYQLEDRENIEVISKIEPIFKRPKLKINKFKINSIIGEIDFSLPKEELIAYISKIKDDFDKDNSIIKTPLELLGETLEKSDNKKTPKKPKASVYADWFYIYDYWKYEKIQGKTDKDIFVALEVENNVPYKEDMLRKIRDKMKYFIDDLGYKELITGVKNS